MKVKTYEGQEEQALLNQIKNELGNNTLILSIKKTKPKGIFALIRKEKVIITAAVESEEDKRDFTRVNLSDFNPVNKGGEKPFIDKNEINSFMEGLRLQQNINNKGPNKNEDKQNIDKENPLFFNTEEDLKEEIERLKIKIKESQKKIAKLSKNVTMEYDNDVLQITYNTLLDENVDSRVAKHLIDIAKVKIEKKEIENNINSIVKIVYNTIIEIISHDPQKELQYNELIQSFSKVLVFMGPTGVGKTTTIAKIASNLVLANKTNIGLITSDTYRIAASKQLQTYADILEIEMETAYNQNDIVNSLENYKNTKDYILVDTAGRSHKNHKNIDDLKNIVSVIEPADKFLVLSLTTKNSDLEKIIKSYDNFKDYKIIFTKADETDSFGTILNVCYFTGIKASLITNGQNVPHDISIIKAKNIAKSLLGLEVEKIC